MLVAADESPIHVRIEPSCGDSHADVEAHPRGHRHDSTCLLQLPLRPLRHSSKIQLLWLLCLLWLCLVVLVLVLRPDTKLHCGRRDATVRGKPHLQRVVEIIP